MPARSHAPLRSWVPLAAVVVAVMALAPRVVRAQRVGGAIGVSLTVLQPVATQAVRVTGLTVERNGVARLETTAPTSGEASQLVMTTVSSSANGFVPVSQTPILLQGASAGAVGSVANAPRRMSYLVNVGKTERSAAPRDVVLRIEYLAVAGT